MAIIIIIIIIIIQPSITVIRDVGEIILRIVIPLKSKFVGFQSTLYKLYGSTLRLFDGRESLIIATGSGWV